MPTEKAATVGAAGLRARILQYLATHPMARDTEEGVCHCWLSSKASSKDVCAALEQLVADGAVCVYRLANGSRVYGAKRVD